jgi:hypothetical protein
VPFISATVSHGTRIEQSAAGDEKGGQMDTQKDQDKPTHSSNTEKGKGDRKSEGGEGGQMDTQKDQDKPSRSSNMEKGKGDRKSEWGEGTSEGAGASKRPMDEEIENQKSDVRNPKSDR